MAKSAKNFECLSCGYSSPKWFGRCPKCGSWEVEEVAAFSSPHSSASPSPLTPSSAPAPITDIDSSAKEKTRTGVQEFDRVLGGGFVPGGVILLTGEPGVGKSTLLLDVAAHCARNQKSASTAQSAQPVLYISGEESSAQVKLRAERIHALDPQLLIASMTDITLACRAIEKYHPALVIIDSIQTMLDSSVEGIAGGSAQVRSVAHVLVNVAKTHNIPMMIVGHVTKDGSIAGPRILEHIVDVVCQFEGDRHSPLRMVRAVKNRFGPTDEVGCFELRDSGIVGLADPSGLFLSARDRSVPGTCATITLEGRRPMPVEIQGLVVPSSSTPRRTVSGVDSSRVAMMVAVLQSRLGYALDRSDVFASTVGGARAYEPACDSALALALASAHDGLPLARAVVAIGEISLTGEFRPVTGLTQRLNEAARLGFKKVITGKLPPDIRVPAGIDISQCRDINDALEAVLPANIRKK